MPREEERGWEHTKLGIVILLRLSSKMSADETTADENNPRSNRQSGEIEEGTGKSIGVSQIHISRHHRHLPFICFQGSVCNFRQQEPFTLLEQKLHSNKTRRLLPKMFPVFPLVSG